MPTRIVLREPPPLPQQSQQRQRQRSAAAASASASASAADDDDGTIPPAPSTPVRRTSSQLSGGSGAASPTRGGGGGGGGGGNGLGGSASPAPRFGLTKAAERALSVSKDLGRDGGDYDDDESDQRRRDLHHPHPHPQHPHDESFLESIAYGHGGVGGRISRRDIIASPRLVGYMFNFIASLICMVSAIMFERRTFGGEFFLLSPPNATEPMPTTDGLTDGSGRRNASSDGRRRQQLQPPSSSLPPAAEAMLYEVAVVGGPGQQKLWYDPYGIRRLQEEQQEELPPPPLDDGETDGSGNATEANEANGSGNSTTGAAEDGPGFGEEDGSGARPTARPTAAGGDGTNSTDVQNDGVIANATEGMGIDSNSTANGTSAVGANASMASDRNATLLSPGNATGSNNATNGTAAAAAASPPPSESAGPSFAQSAGPSFAISEFPSAAPTRRPTASPTVTISPTTGSSSAAAGVACPPLLENASLPSLPNSNGTTINGTAGPDWWTVPPNCYPTASPTVTASPTERRSGAPSVPPTAKPTLDNLLGCTTDCGAAPPRRAVTHWKMWAAIVVPAFSCLVDLAVILAHFDKTFLPEFWRETFKDGSVRELVIIWSVIALWIFGLYVCTSVNSVGYVQANVYFSAWAAFGTALMTWKLWREGADRRSLLTIMANHARKTTYNWFWFFIFSTIAIFSLLDLHVEKLDPSSTWGEMLQSLPEEIWERMWILTGVTSSLCVMVPLLNHALTRPQTDSRTYLRTIRIVFRQVEGLILLSLIGVWSYIIFKFTGNPNIINGINNPYFGVWGTFFACILTFGSWLHDKKNVAWVEESITTLTHASNRGINKSGK